MTSSFYVKGEGISENAFTLYVNSKERISLHGHQIPHLHSGNSQTAQHHQSCQQLIRLPVLSEPISLQIRDRNGNPTLHPHQKRADSHPSRPALHRSGKIGYPDSKTAEMCIRDRYYLCHPNHPGGSDNHSNILAFRFHLHYCALQSVVSTNTRKHRRRHCADPFGIHHFLHIFFILISPLYYVFRLNQLLLHFPALQCFYYIHLFYFQRLSRLESYNWGYYSAQTAE